MVLPSSNRATRRASSGGVSALDQCGGGLFEVVPHLVGDFLVRPRSIREYAQSASQLGARETCAGLPTFKTRAMADARRAQSAVSISSCLRPARVSV